MMTMCICMNLYIDSITELNASKETEYRMPRDINVKKRAKTNTKNPSIAAYTTACSVSVDSFYFYGKQYLENLD